uniref:adenine phosphoribosyltransferase n=1 Tax=Neolamprologus brichardi TaxID=32507 RepID=A0A3Q4HRB6_NEOBR
MKRSLNPQNKTNRFICSLYRVELCLILGLCCVALNVDICPILKDPAALKAVIDLFEEHVRNNHQHVDLIVGKKNKSRALKLLDVSAQQLTESRVVQRDRKPTAGYQDAEMSRSLQETQFAEAEIQEDAVAPGQRVLLVDDLLATGGTLYAASELMRKQQAEVLGCMVVIELKELNGVDKLKLHRVFSLLQY